VQCIVGKKQNRIQCSGFGLAILEYSKLFWNAHP